MKRVRGFVFVTVISLAMANAALATCAAPTTAGEWGDCIVQTWNSGAIDNVAALFVKLPTTSLRDPYFHVVTGWDNIHNVLDAAMANAGKISNQQIMPIGTTAVNIDFDLASHHMYPSNLNSLPVKSMLHCTALAALDASFKATRLLISCNF
jgi:hypothetical protein